MESKKPSFKIYKLLCDDNHYYYGSTVSKYLSSRFCCHRNDSDREEFKNNKLHSHIRSIGWDRVKIILVAEFPFVSHDDRRRKENEYIVAALNDPLCLNHNRAYITDEERKKKSFDNNTKLKTERSQMVLCECGLEHTKGRTEQHKSSLKHRLKVNPI